MIKQTLKLLGIIVAIFLTGSLVAVAAGLTIPQGGTGNTSYVQGTIPIGPGTGLSGLRFATSSALTYATSTNTLTTTNLTIGSASGIGITTTGVFSTIAGTTCTNQFLRAFTISGGTCATVSASDVALANLTATNSTLTFSGTYDGSTARTIGLNLGNANTWTALQQFTGNASSTQLSVPNTLYWGSTATSSLTSTGSIGIGTTSPFAALALDRTQGLASSTIAVREYAYGTATSTPELIDCRTASQTHIRIGAAAQALQINSSSMIPGQKCIVVVENPGGTAGPITWSVTTGAILKWAGGSAPSQTTTANAMDVWSFLMTTGSTSNAILGAATTGF